MRLSKYEKIRSRRERDFQRAVLDELASRVEPRKSGLIKRTFSRTFKIVNSAAFLTALGLLISFGIFFHHTYAACVADSRKAWQDYAAVRFELFQRQAQIATDAFDSNSIKELKDRLAQSKFFDRQFKEDSTAELQARQMLQASLIDQSGAGRDVARTLLEKVEGFDKYKALFFNGYFDDRTIRDSDFPILKQLAVGVLQANALSFIAELRHVGQIECGPTNVVALMLGEQPVTVRKFDAGSFVERERIHQQVEAQRNHLAPMTAPPSFPQTTFTNADQAKP